MKTVLRKAAAAALLFALLAWPAADLLAAKPPTISDVSTSYVLADRATITWTTNVAADSQVEYGKTTKYGSSSPRDNTLVTNHSVTITGLSPNTTYHFRAKSSASAGGSQTASADYTLTTRPLPPLAYAVTLWDAPGRIAKVLRMNNLGQIGGAYYDPAGFERGFLYDPSLNPNAAADLEAIYPAPEGWRICRVGKINDQGVVVGTLVPEDQASTEPIRRAFWLDTGAAQPTVAMLPNWGDWDYIYPSDVNNAGDIFGVYEAADGFSYVFVVNLAALDQPTYLEAPVHHDVSPFAGYLNNPTGGRAAQVVGYLDDANFTLYRWTVGGQLETFPGNGNGRQYGAGGLNDAGTICGGTSAGATRPNCPILIPANSSTPQFLTGAGPSAYFATAMNNSGDVVIQQGSYARFLYRADWTAYGNYVNIDKLLHFQSPADAAEWANAFQSNAFSMSERGNANAGEISGVLFTDVTRGFLLTPTAP